MLSISEKNPELRSASDATEALISKTNAVSLRTTTRPHSPSSDAFASGKTAGMVSVRGHVTNNCLNSQITHDSNRWQPDLMLAASVKPRGAGVAAHETTSPHGSSGSAVECDARPQSPDDRQTTGRAARPSYSDPKTADCLPLSTQA